MAWHALLANAIVLLAAAILARHLYRVWQAEVSDATPYTGVCSGCSGAAGLGAGAHGIDQLSKPLDSDDDLVARA